MNNLTIINLIKIIKEWENNYGPINCLTYDELNEVIGYIDDSIKIFFPESKENYKKYLDEMIIHNDLYDIDIQKIDVISKLNNNDKNEIKINIDSIMNSINNFTTVEKRDDIYDILKKYIVFNNNKLEQISKQYDYLINLPQPVQKSPEWFALRNDMITASNCAAAIGEEKYKSIKDVILDKTGFGKAFIENKFVYHGKKYEKIAILIYEQIYNTKIGEFGLIPHDTHKFLGASPDGISMNLTLDNKVNDRVGRMLEIKCPLTRKILSEGIVDGEICPHYYWVQVQVQLECCNLEECDFWQCSLSEYGCKEDYLDDDCSDTEHTIEQNTKIKINDSIKKGRIIEFLPKDKSNIGEFESPSWYAKYIYPSNILMSDKEYDEWIKNQFDNLQTNYPDIYENYKFSKVKYWKLDKSHNILITRDRQWFANALPKFRNIWNKIVYYRNNKAEVETDIISKRLTSEQILNCQTDKIITNRDIFFKNVTTKNLEKNDDYQFSSETTSPKKVYNKYKPVIINDDYQFSSEDIK